MPHFSWTRASYIVFAIAVFAALIRLWNPHLSSPESLAFENGPRNGPETRQAPETSLPEAARIPGTTRKAPGYERADAGLPDRAREEREPEAPSARQKPYSRDRAAAVREPAAAGTSVAARAPVFYRPAAPEDSSGGGRAGRSAASGPVCGDLGSFPRSRRVVFPLSRDYFYSYEDTWGAPRPQGGHEGTDLMTPTGVPEYAVTDGTVVPVSGSNAGGWNRLGGYAVMVRADHDIGPVREGDLFYYAHLEERSPLEIGDRVRAGQVVGYAGDTGHGPEGTQGLFPAHLHLGWYDGSGNRSAVESGAMNPYPLLEWLKRNGGSVVGGTGARYCEALPPERSGAASGDAPWQPPAAPGPRPDLDTGTDDPRPSPVVKKPIRSGQQVSNRYEKPSPAKAREERRREVRAEPSNREMKAGVRRTQRAAEKRENKPVKAAPAPEDRRRARTPVADGRPPEIRTGEEPRPSPRTPGRDSPEPGEERRPKSNPPPDDEGEPRADREPRDPPVSKPEKDECRALDCAASESGAVPGGPEASRSEPSGGSTVGIQAPDEARRDTSEEAVEETTDASEDVSGPDEEKEVTTGGTSAGPPDPERP